MVTIQYGRRATNKSLSKQGELKAFVHDGFGSLWILLEKRCNFRNFGIVEILHGKYGNHGKIRYIFWKNKKVLVTGHTGFKGSD